LRLSNPIRLRRHSQGVVGTAKAGGFKGEKTNVDKLIKLQQERDAALNMYLDRMQLAREASAEAMQWRGEMLRIKDEIRAVERELAEPLQVIIAEA
jgi:hypothetical protein